MHFGHIVQTKGTIHHVGRHHRTSDKKLVFNIFEHLSEIVEEKRIRQEFPIP
jgi:hypothetical protein